jgi:hypothetical protein
MTGWKWLIVAAALPLVAGCGKDDTTGVLGPLQIEVASGSGQRGFLGQALAAPLVARVKNSAGDPVPGATVTFEVASGGGVLSSTTAETDSRGLAQTTLTLGLNGDPSVEGPQTVTASIVGANGSPIQTTFSVNGVFEVFTTNLSVAAEGLPPTVPEPLSGATGEATVTVKGNRAEYRVVVRNLTTPVTVSHIHGPAAPEATASPVVDLSVGAGATTYEVTGSFSTTAGVRAPNTYADVLNMMRQGMTYVNVHSQRYPGGEIRGQLLRNLP